MFDSNSLKVDSQKMYQIYDMWPEIAEKSFSHETQTVNFDQIEHIVFSGMGGSGAIGDLFSSLLSKTNIHVQVVKGYTLPKTVGSNTLVIPISISGNTDETLSTMKQAKNETDCKIVAFSSGGKFGNFCKENNIEFKIIDKIHSPRTSFVKYIYSMLKILSPIIPITNSEVLDSITTLKETKKNIYSENISSNNLSLSLAEGITSIPLIYYPGGLESAAMRFKNSLQENAKTHAIKEEILEACHNNVVSWETKSDIKPILLQGTDDHPNTKERWKILKEFFNDKGIEFQEVFSTSGNILTKLMNMIYLLDYSSIYLAIQRGIDPTPVNSIDYIKNKL